MAGSRSLGVLTLDLIAKIGGFTGPLDQAGRVADKRLREIERRAKQFGKVLGTAFIAAGTAIAVGVKHAIDQADQLNDLNVRLGISAEALSGWAYAAKQSGTDIDGLGIGLKKLTKNLAEALDPKSHQAKLFDALDIEPLDKATGKLKSLEQILPEISEKFKDLHDDTLEAALAQELFGKSGADLLEFLNLGAGGIEEMRSKLRDLGGELNDETLKAADQLNDHLGDLRTATDGLYTALAADLLPQLDAMVVSMVDATKEGSELRGVVDGLVTVFDYLTMFCRNLDNIWRGLVSTGIALYKVLDSVSQIGPNAFLHWGDFTNSLAENWNAAKVAADQALGSFSKVGEEAAVATAKVAGFGKGIRGGGGHGFSGVKPTGMTASEKALYNLLGNPEDPKTPKKTGKSDAEREAEQLAAAVKRMNDQMAEQIALFGKTTEVAKLRYDLENGELAKASEAEKQNLLQKAAILDQLKLEAEETERLNKIDEERRETVERAHKALAETFSDLQFEIDLLGKSNAERMAEIELRRIGIGLSDQEREAAKTRLIAMEEEYEALQKQVSAMDEVRGSFEDIFTDVLTGQKSLLDGLKSFADAFIEQLARMVAAQASTALFGTPGTPGGGSIGGFFSGLLNAFLPAHAAGTNFAPGGLSLVGERGPELVNLPRGAQVIPADKTAKALRGGGPLIGSMSITVPAGTSRDTADQIAAKVGLAVQRAMARNF